MEKYSKLIFDFASAIIDGNDDETTVQNKMKVAQIFWNYPIAKQFFMPAFKKLDEEVSKEFSDDEGFRQLGELLIERKKTDFAEHNHFIRNLLVHTSPEGEIEIMVSTFSPARYIGVGTTAKPAMVIVKTEDEAFDILAEAKQHDWHVLAEVIEDAPEDLLEWELLKNGLIPGPDFKLNPSKNAPCICGSGKLYKRCCGR